MIVMHYNAENTSESGAFWVLYLPVESGLELLPADLRARLGALYPQYELDVENDTEYLRPEQKTAIEKGIAEKGYYLEESQFRLSGLSEDVDLEI